MKRFLTSAVTACMTMGASGAALATPLNLELLDKVDILVGGVILDYTASTGVLQLTGDANAISVDNVLFSDPGLGTFDLMVELDTVNGAGTSGLVGSSGSIEIEGRLPSAVFATQPFVDENIVEPAGTDPYSIIAANVFENFGFTFNPFPNPSTFEFIFRGTSGLLEDLYDDPFFGRNVAVIATGVVDPANTTDFSSDFSFNLNSTRTADVAPVPLPAPFALLGAGLAGLGFFGRRRRAAAA